MAELADASDSKSDEGDLVRVRFPSSASKKKAMIIYCRLFFLVQKNKYKYGGITMITKANLINDLRNMEIDPKGTVLVHISYKSIGDVEGIGYSVVEALMEYMKEGLLVLPTHTWNNINIHGDTIMDITKTPVCVGILPEIFRGMEGVQRSIHPTHSVGAYGSDAEEFISGEEFSKSPCPKNSVYHKLLERNATILLIGVDFTKNTFIHGVEEWNNVPNRLTEEPHDLYVIGKDGKKYHTPQNRHTSDLGSTTYWKLEDLMFCKGAMRKGTFGNAEVMICDSVKLNDILSKMLAVDIDVLSDNEPLHDKWFSME